MPIVIVAFMPTKIDIIIIVLLHHDVQHGTGIRDIAFSLFGVEKLHEDKSQKNVGTSPLAHQFARTGH